MNIKDVQSVQIYNIAINPCGIGGTETFSRVLNKYYPNSKTYCFGVLSKVHYKVPYVLVKRYWYTKILPRFVRSFFSTISFYSFPTIKNSIIIINAPVDLDRVPRLKLKRNKVIYLAHNEPNHIWNHKNYFGRNRKSRLKAMRHVDKVVTLSPSYIPELSKLFNFPKEKFTSVTHTVEVLPVLSTKTFKKKVITICRIDNKQKRLDRFVEVAKALPSYSFEIYGFGKDEGLIKDLIKEYPNISFLGATNDIGDAHKDAGVFLITSDFEGFAIAPIEALSQATPVVIAPNSYGMAKQVIRNGENGFVCENFSVNEVVEKILLIEKEYDTFSKNALESFKRYDSNSFVKQWNTIFEEL